MSIAKLVKDYIKTQGFIKDLEQTTAGRNFKSMNLSKIIDFEENKTKTAQNLNVYIKSKNNEQEDLTYVITIEKSKELLSSPIYRMVVSDDEKYITYFKKMKATLTDYGIKFQKSKTQKKKGHDGYVIILNDFFDTLAMLDYEPGDHEFAKRVLADVIKLDHPDFSFEISQDNSFYEFMALMDETFYQYNKILNLPVHEAYEACYDVYPDYNDPENYNTFLEAESFSLVSIDEIKQEKNYTEKVADLQNEDDLAKFRQEQVDDNLEIVKQKDLTVLQEFSVKFGKELSANGAYYQNLLTCFDYLINNKYDNNVLFGMLSPYLADNLEAVIFMTSNRGRFVADIQKAVSATKGAVGANDSYAKVSGNVTIHKKGSRKKQKNKSVPLKIEILKLMGMEEEKILTTQSYQLKMEFLRREEEKNRQDAEDNQFLQDFVGEDDSVLAKKFGMTRKEKGFNIVFDVTPAQKNIIYKTTDRRKIVDNFPPFIVPCFTDSDSLNNLQSIIYDIVYGNDDNVLCCAPTGAGKTNVALMSILRLVVKNYSHEFKKVSNDFKIVYISPLKALAQEIVGKFQKKLEHLGVRVREFTGDMSISKKDLAVTHIIVSTPEKWDVTTRKSEELNSMISLLIIDEIHLLDDERGRVLECLIARTVRLIEAKQCRIRILGLSATLPNYKDVARLCKVSERGLFFFDESYRPVPLYKKFVGVRKPNVVRKPEDRETMKKLKAGTNIIDLMDQNCYDILMTNLKMKKQVLIFVHSRRETVNLAQKLINIAIGKSELQYICTEKTNPNKISRKFENKDLKGIAQKGIGCHNAGLKRRDRNGVEKAFISGELSTVVCTATLAWGINMPCHTVIIKGTDFYKPGHGFTKISLLDVQQIFGRAGRPQFDKYGEACLITKAEDLNYFISMLSYVKPIESQFLPFLNEALLAEIVLGNINNLQEAIEFVKSTFLYIRLKRNPDHYKKNLGNVDDFLIDTIMETLKKLHTLRLIRYDTAHDIIESTELGRIGSHYYINCETMEKLCKYLNLNNDDDNITDIRGEDLISVVAQSSEFDQISAKPDEEGELKKLKKQFEWIKLNDEFTKIHKEKTDAAKQKGKANPTFDNLEKVVLLFWGYLRKVNYEVYSLEADTKYITQNATRVMRCLLEMSVKQNNGMLAETILVWIRYLENCVDEDSTPLRVFCYDNYKRSVYSMKNTGSEINRLYYLTNVACRKLEDAANYTTVGEYYSDVWNLRENSDLINELYLSKGNHNMVLRAIKAYPILDISYDAKPIAQTILQITVKIKARFIYNKTWHMFKENFWVFVSDGPELLHHGSVAVDSQRANLYPLQEDTGEHRKNYLEHTFFVPFRERAKSYKLLVMSDRFVNSDSFCDIELEGLIMNYEKMEYTDLLDLQPLRISVLQNKKFESLFSEKITFFNAIQTQVFFAMYQTDENVLIGAPTGSGKTIVAELAMLRLLATQPGKKVVYVAPYKALVKERLKDWEKRFKKKLGINVEELSGDYTPNPETLIKADILVTTPEKWDGVSRSWQSRAYVKSVALIIFDEIHLLGQERGPVIEVIVSRMNYISNQIGLKTRMVGLSTAIANGADVGSWFGVKRNYMFNFRPSVRPVPIEIHFRGFSEKNYCPRMNSMNKPAFIDIKKLANGLSTLIFVSSRRQTRLTALDIIALSANDFVQASPFLKMSFDELDFILNQITDKQLKETLSFGIGMHHAGLVRNDRIIVEELFESGKIQVLVATSTLAWGVNFPAKLVIVKGTEFFDAKTHGYVDMPITDILQMVGRAGRPQYNDKGFACVYVENSKKNFYRKYLNDPFPIESAFLSQIDVHLNAEVASLSIVNKQQCIDYLTWTYFFKRLIRNPVYYGLKATHADSIQKYMIDIIDTSLNKLKENMCVELDEDQFEVSPTFYGTTASKYYLKPETVKYLAENLDHDLSLVDLIKTLCNVEEYSEVPVRHNEDKMNVLLSDMCPYKIKEPEAGSPKVKTFLLFQAYFSDLPLPIRDYITDTKLVIDSAFRIIAAMIDISADYGRFRNCYYLVQIVQMFVQGTWINSSGLINVPYFDKDIVAELGRNGLAHLFELQLLQHKGLLRGVLAKVRARKLKDGEINKIVNCIGKVPLVKLSARMFKYDSETGEKDKREGRSFRGGDEAIIQVELIRVNYKENQRVDMKRISKAKSYSWWLFVGNLETGRIFAVKKLSFAKKAYRSLVVDIPNFGQGSDRHLSVYLLSDSFIGIDQVVNFDLVEYTSGK